MAFSNIALKAISTFFYIGYLPFMPGTFGSLAGLFLFYLIGGNSRIYSLFTLQLIITGFWVAGKTERILNVRDPKCIVIDEISGMLLALAFIPYDLKLVLIGFLLFRIFDTLKPYPINKLQERKGSIGIMCDDIIAGFYTNIILQAVLRLASFKIS